MDSAYNFLTFHRDEARHQYFSTRDGRDVFFDPRIKTWIVTDPSHCRQLIGSDNLRPASYVEDYRALSRRFDIDFSGLVFAFSHIPLCLHGDDHARFRRKASEFLAGRRAAVAARIPELTARHFRAFNRLGKIELMREVLEPLAHEYIGLIAGIEIDAAHCDQASQIFDRSSGLNKRIAMEAEIALLRELVASRLDKSATEEEVGLRLAYIILGKDPLKGTLGESLRKIFESNAGSKLSDIDFPEYPPETGVPFIERLVLETFNFGAHDSNRETGSVYFSSRWHMILLSAAQTSLAQVRTPAWADRFRSSFGTASQLSCQACHCVPPYCHMLLEHRITFSLVPTHSSWK
jgi:hypothetical protein